MPAPNAAPEPPAPQGPSDPSAPEVPSGSCTRLAPSASSAPVGPSVPATHREVRLAARLRGALGPEHFTLAEAPVPAAGPGRLLVRNRVMTVTAAMCSKMTDAELPMPSFVPGQALWGPALGEVVQTSGGGFVPGDLVVHPYGWREFAVVEEGRARRVEPGELPDSAAYLSQGATAWGALTRAARVRPDDTVFVTGAAGGVGSTAGLIAKRLGAARVIGSTGSAHKAPYLREALGYDDVVLRGAGPVEEQLRRAAPDGIDVLLDLVGGEQLRAALAVARTGARFALVGALSEQLGGGAGRSAPAEVDSLLMVTRRVTLRGFSMVDHPDLPQEWTAEFGRGLRDGSLVFARTLVRGLDQAPRALCELTRGCHTGAVLVEL
ncbi:NADP-dependent oxidoreductase [Streptomyces paromomycinus]|uniref:NADP-dependent oxidoreductase n=1 Tax=Streptomyces paromomycinus TaxID=92743 RepID=A0A401VZ19_STREY|nr:NADP-dependent oxidoreductase [Streptomyces paromomycinus]